MPQRIIEHPTAAVLAATGSALIAEVVNGPLSALTQFCAAGTGVFVFLFWARKFVIQFLHDLKHFKRGKLPPVDATTPDK